MSSDGPYGRHGFNANAGGYGGASYSSQPGGGGYMAPSYGQGYGSYGDSANGAGAYPSYGQQGGPMDYNQVRCSFQPRRQEIIPNISFIWSER